MLHITPALSPGNALGQLPDKVARLSLEDRRVAWAVYRRCRRSVALGFTEARVQELSRELHAKISPDEPYTAITLGLKLARAKTVAELRSAGAPGRRPRALAIEGFHLLRVQLREHMGERIKEEPVAVLFGTTSSMPRGIGWSDGGVRKGQAAAGIAFYAESLQLARTAAISLITNNPLEAELIAANHCLAAMSSAGIRNAVLNVDALGVIRALQGRLTVRMCTYSTALVASAQVFERLEVRLVPRAFNEVADGLATSIFY